LNFNRDGQGRHTITKGKVNYWPNRFEANPPTGHTKTPGGFESYPTTNPAMKKRMLTPKWTDYLSQAQLFYNSLTKIEKMHLTNALCFELDHCEEAIVYERLVTRLTEIDLELAQTVAMKVGAPTPQEQTIKNPGKTAKGLSQFDFQSETPTIKSRRIAILIADGYDSVSYNGIVAAIKAQQALPFTIAPKRQAVKASDGSSAKPDHFLNGMRSTMFDSVFVPSGEESVKTLMGIGLARFWVREAFGHLKAIGAVGDGVKLVEAAVKEAEGYKLASGSETLVNWYGVVTTTKPDNAASPQGVVEILKDAKDFIGNYFYEISMHRNWARELDGLADMVTV